MPAKALFFDVGNTLLFPNRKRMLHALHKRQIFPSDDQLKQIERRTKREFDPCWKATPPSIMASAKSSIRVC
jgi:hypothetical protein